MIDAAQMCIADVETVLQSIATLRGKVLNVYNENELSGMTNVIMTYPACGVVYEGMRSMAESGSTGKIGVSSELVISVFLLDLFGKGAKQATKKNAAPILDAIRNLMMGRRSPTGHLWRFVVEAAAAPNHKDGTVLWVQRWSVPVQLISNVQR